MAYPNWDEQTMRKRTWRRLLALSGLDAGLTDVPPRMDIFVTGLVLGTSSLPAHAVITNVGELISRFSGGGKGGGSQSI